MVKQKVVIGVFRHGESKFGLYYVPTLLLYRFLANFLVRTRDGFCLFSIKQLGFG